MNVSPWFAARNDLILKETGELDLQWATTYYANPTFKIWDDSKTFKKGGLIANGLTRYTALKDVPKYTQLHKSAYWQQLTRK